MRNPSASFHRVAVASAACVVSAANLLGGCASEAGDSQEFGVAAGSYDAAFDATREVLRGLDFELERVDAASGVITTKPHFSQGLFEPWDETQSSATDEWEDAMNTQAREVRVTFVPAGDVPDAPPDLRESEEPLLGSVRVTILRQQRAGRRLDSEWVGGSSFYSDPLFEARTGSRYLVPLRRDERLEARIAGLIGQATAAQE